MNTRDSQIESTLLALGLSSEFDLSTRSVMLDKLTNLSDETLALIPAILEIHHAGVHQLKFLYTLLGKTDEQSVRETLFYRARMGREVNDLLQLTQGLHSYDRFRDTPRLDQLSGDDLDAATALLSVTAYLTEHYIEEHVSSGHYDKNEHYVRVITNEALIDLIASNPDKTGRLIRFIGDRRSTDPEMLRDYIEDLTPLREGVL